MSWSLPSLRPGRRPFPAPPPPPQDYSATAFDDSTGPSDLRDDDLWTLAEDSFSEASFIEAEEAESAVNVGAAAVDWDVRSYTSETSVRSSQSISSRSVTSTAAAELAVDNGGRTASTVGLPIPLAVVPPAMLRGHHRGASDDDASSLASVNTRRGWPRVSPHTTVPAEVTRRASYKDMLLAPVTTEAASGVGGGGSAAAAAALRHVQQRQPSSQQRSSRAGGSASSVPLVPKLLRPVPPVPPSSVAVRTVGGRVRLIKRDTASRATRHDAGEPGRRNSGLATLHEESFDDEDDMSSADTMAIVD